MKPPKQRIRVILLAIAIILLLPILMIWSYFRALHEQRRLTSPQYEKQDIVERRDYLLSKLIASPEDVLGEMPASVGPQFQGEWALYSCSMLSAALANISKIYPETKADNLQNIAKLIDIVLSPELRRYDTMRWDEDALTSLDGRCSHISYLSHLAWMICEYKGVGGGTQYDSLLSSICEAMNRRITRSKAFNLPTYPGEPIYIPDMLVAIVALQKYGDMNYGKYHHTVQRWLELAQSKWIDHDTGVLASYLDWDGEQFTDMPIRGSFSALSCYYLTMVDQRFAREQYDRLKALFWKEGAISGLKEYHDRTCYFGMDIDSGPILLELSPSGTAFFAGTATLFGDKEVCNGILRTAEFAGCTIGKGGNRHYLLANIALVGESIVLAMRTNRGQIQHN